MAQKRMFSKKIIQTDRFLEMPLSTQCFYFHLNLDADDDGFVSNVKTIKRMVGANDDDLNLLIAKQFLISFESGVVVVKDWLIHNTLKRTRGHYTKTIFDDEMSYLIITKSKSYEYSDLRNRNVSASEPQVRLELDEVSEVELSLEKVSIELDKEIESFIVSLNLSEDKTKSLSEIIIQTKKSEEKKIKVKLKFQKKDIKDKIQDLLTYCVDFELDEYSKYLNTGFTSFWKNIGEKSIKVNQYHTLNKKSQKIIPDEEYFKKMYIGK